MLNLLYIMNTTPPKGTYIMKKLILTSAIALLVASPLAMAKDLAITSNSSSVKDADFINSMASAANGMGAKEPLTISESNDGGKRVLVAAHGNSLRALAKHIEGISDNDIMGLEIPTGQPLVYKLDDDLNVVEKFYL